MAKGDYYAAEIPEPFIVLKVQLRPFSFGHFLLLNRAQSPFVCGASEVNLTDLAAAVFICALSWRDNLDALYTGRVERKWGPCKWKEPVDKFMLRWERAVAGFDFQSAVELFRRYVDEGMQIPLFSYEEGGEGGASDPTELAERIKAVLLGELHIAESAIYDRPWRLCVRDYVRYLVKAKLIRLEDEEAYNAFAKAAEEYQPCQALN